MNLIEVLKNKEKILSSNNIVSCNKCGERFFSSFDKLYITAKGECFVCNEDEKLAENILNNL